MPVLRGNPRHTAVRGTLVAALGLLASCGVRMQPDYEMPQPMMKPMAAKVGLLIDEPLRKYTHEETRAGGNWKINLGPGHDHLFRSMFSASFQPLQVFTDIDAARAAGMQVIFEPGIEQYSFVTANETASGYWAVTLRYRIAVLDPTGAAVDSFSLTGYGSAYGERGSEASLTAATRSAMRDAAAKFLVQMPRQALSQKLMAGQSVSAADKAAATDVVETVPIDPAPAT